MFSDKVLEWIFARKEMQKLTFGEQSEFVHDLQKILEKEQENDSES